MVSYTKGYLIYKKVKFDYHKVDFDGYTRFKISNTSNVKIGKGFLARSSSSSFLSNSANTMVNVGDKSTLIIGDFSGFTDVVINCYKSVTIGNFVNIGRGSLIMDSNMHSLDWRIRSQRSNEAEHTIKKPIIIDDYAFIGARCIICKGVRIGKHSIVAAGSVVIKDIPDDEIWGGSPAKFISKVS